MRQPGDRGPREGHARGLTDGGGQEGHSPVTFSGHKAAKKICVSDKDVTSAPGRLRQKTPPLGAGGRRVRRGLQHTRLKSGNGAETAQEAGGTAAEAAPGGVFRVKKCLLHGKEEEQTGSPSPTSGRPEETGRKIIKWEQVAPVGPTNSRNKCI